MSGSYLIALIVSIAGLAIIDFRYKLAYFKHRARTLWILLTAILVFIAWDVAGIYADIFFIGSNNLLVGLHIGEFPVEELLFLLLLNYSALIIYLFLKTRAKA